MSVNQPDPARRFESRWPVVLVILGVLGVLALLPGRITLSPRWLPFVVAAVVLSPVVATQLAVAKERWLRVERVVTLVFVIVATVSSLANLANLTAAIIFRSKEISGPQLLASSIGVWATNVLVFSLLYWQIDRGGPEGRMNRSGTRPDWLFPQEGVASADLPPGGWTSTFVDYLYLAHSTATGTTDAAAPLTARAKLLMMLENMISLTVIVVIASRAINILGS